MSQVKISDLPEITVINANTANTLFAGVDIPTDATFKMTAKTLAKGLYSNEVLNVGINPVTFDNVVAQFSGNSSPYLQLNLQNFSNTGSGDIVITSDVGTDANSFLDLGLNSSQFNDPAYSAMEALDGYLFVQGPETIGHRGNLTIGTTSSDANVNFSVGGTTKGNIVAYFTKDGLTLNNASYLTFNDGSQQTIAYDPNIDTTQNTRLTNIETVNTNQNTSITVIQGVDNAQNTRLTNIETVNTNQNTSITIIQGVNDTQNSEITAVNNFTQAAFNKANNALANATGTFAGDLTITGNTIIHGQGIDIINSSFPNNESLVQITAADNGAYVAPSNTNYLLHITGKANSASRFVIDSFGANTYPLVSGRMGRGSAATPTAVANNDVLMRVVGNGYTGTQFPSSSPTKIDFVATENFSDTNRGTAIQFWNTPNGSNTIQKIAQFNANEVSFTGTVNPTKGFIYTPVIYPGAQTAITLDISDGPLVRAQTTSGLTVTLSNFTAGKIIELWVTNLAGSTQTFTHGVSAINSTVGSTSVSMAGGSTISARYVCLDGTLANTMCAITGV